MLSWSRLPDALLRSPIPPPNWLDERYAGSGWKSRRGRRAGRAYYITPREVQAALAEARSHTNPPVVQGWAWLLGLALVAVETLGLVRFRDGGPMTLLMVLAPLPLWLAAVGFVAAITRDVDVRDGSVFVRSWSAEWFDRPGRRVGSIESVRIVERSRSNVLLAGDAEDVVLSLALWPRASRRALFARLTDGHGESRQHDRRRRS